VASTITAGCGRKGSDYGKDYGKEHGGNNFAGDA